MSPIGGVTSYPTNYTAYEESEAVEETPDSVDGVDYSLYLNPWDNVSEYGVLPWMERQFKEPKEFGTDDIREAFESFDDDDWNEIEKGSKKRFYSSYTTDDIDTYYRYLTESGYIVSKADFPELMECEKRRYHSDWRDWEFPPVGEIDISNISKDVWERIEACSRQVIGKSLEAEDVDKFNPMEEEDFGEIQEEVSYVNNFREQYEEVEKEQPLSSLIEALENLSHAVDQLSDDGNEGDNESNVSRRGSGEEDVEETAEVAEYAESDDEIAEVAEAEQPGETEYPGYEDLVVPKGYYDPISEIYIKDAYRARCGCIFDIITFNTQNKPIMCPECDEEVSFAESQPIPGLGVEISSWIRQVNAAYYRTVDDEGNEIVVRRPQYIDQEGDPKIPTPGESSHLLAPHLRFQDQDVAFDLSAQRTWGRFSHLPEIESTPMTPVTGEMAPFPGTPLANQVPSPFFLVYQPPLPSSFLKDHETEHYGENPSGDNFAHMYGGVIARSQDSLFERRMRRNIAMNGYGGNTQQRENRQYSRPTPPQKARSLSGVPGERGNREMRGSPRTRRTYTPATPPSARSGNGSFRGRRYPQQNHHLSSYEAWESPS